MSKPLLHRQRVISSAWLLCFSLFPSCSEETLEDRARKIIESNQSGQSDSALRSEGLIRSADGKQFTEVDQVGSSDQSVGFAQDGALAYKGGFKDGKPEGTWSTFFPDGSLRWKGEKRNGVNHGPFTMWYENGKVKMSGTFKEGRKDGKSTIWYPSGIKWREQWHSDGQPAGTWKTWDEQGKLVEELDQSSKSPEGNASSE